MRGVYFKYSFSSFCELVLNLDAQKMIRSIVECSSTAAQTWGWREADAAEDDGLAEMDGCMDGWWERWQREIVEWEERWRDEVVRNEKRRDESSSIWKETPPFPPPSAQSAVSWCLPFTLSHVMKTKRDADESEMTLITHRCPCLLIVGASGGLFSDRTSRPFSRFYWKMRN